MSENKKPTLEAGEEIVKICPICKVGFKPDQPTNQKIECPNPECGVTFLVMVYE
jgi:hypothetical protein